MKKNILTLALVIACTVPALAQQTLLVQEITTLTTDEGRQQHIEKKSRKPLSGNYRIVNERLNLYTLCHYRKGYPHGDFQCFRHGVLKESGAYDNGFRHGTWTEFQPDGATPQRQTPLTHGKINGTVRTYFTDGKPKTEKEYTDSRLEGTEKRFDAQTGEIIYLATYRNDKLDGKVVEIYRESEEKTYTTTCYYSEGKRNGNYTFTTLQNGNPPPADECYKTIGEYSNGRKSGTWKSTDRNGKVLSEWHEK